MWKKATLIVLTIAIIISGVGLGIHVLHKDAFALYAYYIEVQVWDPNEQEWTVQPGLEVSFDLPGHPPIEEDTDLFGVATIWHEDGPEEGWDAWFTEPVGIWITWTNDQRLVEGGNPYAVGNGGTTGYLWVEPDDGR